MIQILEEEECPAFPNERERISIEPEAGVRKCIPLRPLQSLPIPNVGVIDEAPADSPMRRIAAQPVKVSSRSECEVASEEGCRGEGRNKGLGRRKSKRSGQQRGLAALRRGNEHGRQPCRDRFKTVADAACELARSDAACDDRTGS